MPRQAFLYDKNIACYSETVTKIRAQTHQGAVVPMPPSSFSLLPLLPSGKMLKAKPFGCPDGQPCPFFRLGASQGRENGSEVQGQGENHPNALYGLPRGKDGPHAPPRQALAISPPVSSVPDSANFDPVPCSMPRRAENPPQAEAMFPVPMPFTGREKPPRSPVGPERSGGRRSR